MDMAVCLNGPVIAVYLIDFLYFYLAHKATAAMPNTSRAAIRI